jgi:hypothetical protein
MGVGKTVYKGEVETGVVAWFLSCKNYWQPAKDRPPQSPVGVSLLAIGECQPMFSCLTHRNREQAHSYRGFRRCGHSAEINSN